MTNQWKSIIHSLPIVILTFILSSAFPACFTQFNVDDNKDTSTDQKDDDSGGDTAGDRVDDQVDDDAPGIDAGDDDAGGEDVEEEEEPFVNPWPGLVEAEPSIVPLTGQISMDRSVPHGYGESGGLLLTIMDNDLLAFSTYETYESTTGVETAHYMLYRFGKDDLHIFGLTTETQDDCDSTFRPWECALDNMIALITEDSAIYLLQAVVRQPVVGDHHHGNIRVLKFDDGYNYVTTSKLIDDIEVGVEIPYPSQLMAVQCSEDYHIIMGPMEEGDGGFQTDLYGVTMDKLGMQDLFKARPTYVSWENVLRFSTEPGRFLTSSACMRGDTLNLGVFDMEMVEVGESDSGWKMQSRILQFKDGPIDGIPDPVELITNPETGEEPPMESMPAIGAMYWEGEEEARLLAAWYANDNVWTDDNPLEWFDLHKSFTDEDGPLSMDSDGNSMRIDFPTITSEQEGMPDFSNYKLFVDEEWEVVYVTGLWYDMEFEPEIDDYLGITTIFIFVFDMDMDALVDEPYMTRVELAALYGYDAIFDQDTNSIYFAWYDYTGERPRTGKFMNQLVVKKYSVDE